MKVGDLVTLSSRAEELQRLWKWSPLAREYYGVKKPLVGIIIRIGAGHDYRDYGKTIYEVRWLEDDGPASRSGKARGNYKSFWRTDLKFVSQG